MDKLISVYENAREELENFIERERIRDPESDLISDEISIIADNCIPIYNSDVMLCAAHRDVWARDDEGLAGPEADLLVHAKVRIYLAIQEHLYSHIEGIIAAACDDCYDCGEPFFSEELMDASQEGLGVGKVCDNCLVNREEARYEEERKQLEEDESDD